MCAGQFGYNEMRCCIFKFKTGALGGWLVGLCGGFEGDDPEPCGHTFSEMQPYRKPNVQSDCIAMVEKIMVYWKERAKKSLKSVRTRSKQAKTGRGFAPPDFIRRSHVLRRDQKLRHC